MTSADVVSVSIRADVANLVSGMRDAGGATSAASRQMQTDLAELAGGSREAGSAVDEFVHHVRGMRREAFLGNFMAKQIAEMGLASKSAAGEVTGLVSAFALGGGIGLAIESVKLLVKEFTSGGAEIEKFTNDAINSVKDLQNKVDQYLAGLRGATEGEKLQHEAISKLLRQEADLKQDMIGLSIKVADKAAEAEEAENKHRSSAAQLALNERDAAVEEYNNKKKLLDITQEQIRLDREQVSRVDTADKGVAKQKAREQASLDAAKWRAYELQEEKKYYDAVTAATLKALEDQDKAEERHAGLVIKTAYESSEAVKKLLEHLDKVRLDEMKRIDEEQTKEEQKRIAAAEKMGTAVGSVFADMIDGQKAVQKGAADMLRAVIDAAFKAVEAYAASAAAAAAFSQAGIPIIGPILAVGALATMEGLVMGLLANIPSAAGGWEIPASVGSGGVLMVGHGGEKMLPADKSAKLDRLLDGGFGADGPELHVHVHALDGQDAYRFFTRPETQRALRELIRNGRWP